MNITVHGAGYVGLVQAAVLADAGHNVLCVDVDAEKIARLMIGQVPIFEPGLADLVAQNSEAGRLSFSADPRQGVAQAAVQFIAVGTPPDEDGAADLRFVMAVADAIASNMQDDMIVVLKSTVPVGTCDKVDAHIAQVLSRRGRRELHQRVASNPEFLKEGAAIADCVKPDRIIIGTDDAEVEACLRELYAPFNRNREKIMVMDRRSAELTKYASNSMLATKISFINEIANLADLLGADIEHVRRGIGADPRIGYQFIYPGIGYGGSCFPKDVRALIQTADDAGFDPVLLRAVEARNNHQKNLLAHKITNYFNGRLAGRTFALWGLAFKPNTDDMRDAPSRTIMEALWSAGAQIRAYDPKALEECQRIYGARPGLQLCSTAEQALAGADALIVATEWKNFQAPDFAGIRAALKEPVIFDGRNIYDPAVVAGFGLDLVAVGRGRIDGLDAEFIESGNAPLQATG